MASTVENSRPVSVCLAGRRWPNSEDYAKYAHSLDVWVNSRLARDCVKLVNATGKARENSKCLFLWGDGQFY